ncbi:MAG: class C sortase [Acutalibacteraceae bacterium]
MKSKSRKSNPRKDRLITVLLAFGLLIALSLSLYPTIADYHNSLVQTTAVAEYSDSVERLREEEYDSILSSARDYNKALKSWTAPYELTTDERARYESQLNLTGNGIMGYLEIPSINCYMPVHHGTNDSVLQTAVGHFEWSSLPVGGKSTHCVLTSHRGLLSANLFTYLDKVKRGDVFMLRVLDEVMTYEVDQILTVLPADTDELRVVDGKDYCTLLTCTPYGINSHRLLVRGHRIPNTEESKAVTVPADAVHLNTIMVFAVVAIALLVLFLIIFLMLGKPVTTVPTKKPRIKSRAKKPKLRKRYRK